MFLEVVPSFSSMVFRQQQQQAQQLNSLCFYQNPEETSSLGTACFWRSFRPSGPWCFAVSQPPARTSLWSCFEGMGAALWSWFLVGSEGNVRHWGPLPAGAFRPSGPWCCAVSQPPARSLLWSRCLRARSVLQGHGVLLFRNRPLGLCCGALWGHESCTLELVSCRSEGNVRHWSLLAGRRFRLSVPWCFAASQPPARTSLWSCFEGMGAALWSWFLVGSEGNVAFYAPLPSFRAMVFCCFATAR